MDARNAVEYIGEFALEKNGIKTCLVAYSPDDCNPVDLFKSAILALEIWQSENPDKHFLGIGAGRKHVLVQYK